MTTTQLDLKDAIKAAIAESMGDIIKSSASATKRLLEKDIKQTVEKKVKLEETPTFKRKYNESQYKHSKEMEKKLSTKSRTQSTTTTSREQKKWLKRVRIYLLRDKS